MALVVALLVGGSLMVVWLGVRALVDLVRLIRNGPGGPADRARRRSRSESVAQMFVGVVTLIVAFVVGVGLLQ